MISNFSNFTNDESGAVTVDWVLITAAVVGLGGLMYFYLHDPIQHLDEQSGQALANVEVDPVSFD